MLNKNDYFGFIAARAGSKGIKNKNLRKINKISIFEWAASALIRSKYLDQSFCASDDDRVKKICNRISLNCEYLRKADLSGDKTTILSLLKDFIKEFNILNKYKYVVLVQATTPTVTSKFIDSCIEKFDKSNAESLITGYRFTSANPAILYKINSDDRVSFLDNKYDKQRQSFDNNFFLRVGMVYIFSISNIINDELYGSNVIHYEIPQELGINIDDIKDLYQARKLLSERKIFEK